MLSLPSIGTRVGLIFLRSAFVPLNFFRLQNLAAAIPSGNPSVVAARLECIKSPQTVCIRSRPRLSLPLLTFVVKPTASERLRFQVNSVVS